jgi:hypothetical protein
MAPRFASDNSPGGLLCLTSLHVTPGVAKTTVLEHGTTAAALPWITTGSSPAIAKQTIASFRAVRC